MHEASFIVLASWKKIVKEYFSKLDLFPSFSKPILPFDCLTKFKHLLWKFFSLNFGSNSPET